MKLSRNERSLYIIDQYCAERINELMSQLSTVVREALQRRRFDPADHLDYGLEEVGLAAAIQDFHEEELDDIF